MLPTTLAPLALAASSSSTSSSSRKKMFSSRCNGGPLY
jgi:hypothetical protein